MSNINSESLDQMMKEESEENANTMKKDSTEKEVEGSKKNKEEEEEEEEKVAVIEVEKGTGGDSGGAVSRDFLVSKKEVKWYQVLLGLRIAAFVFCLKAFSVMAADKQKILVEEPIDVFGDGYTIKESYSFRWNDYDGFKYCFAVNLIGFVYSALQICDLVKYLITKKHTVNPKLRCYINIAIDQALTFLLMSASSSAATTIHILGIFWVIGGGRRFTAMANASVAFSFIAFVNFAFASLVSAFILRRFSY